MRTYNHWISGQDTPSLGSDRISRNAPDTAVEIASFALGGKEDVAAAVAAARRASDEWAAMPAAGRAGLIEAWAGLIARDADRLARIEAEEAGKPISAAQGELGYATDLMRYAAALGRTLTGSAVANDGPDSLGLSLYEPRGVVGMILPWNYPAVCLMMKLPYALAAGCTVVVKPSEFTSGTTLEFARLATEAGLPDGVVNIVTGTGPVVGEAMTASADVDMISFTGSTAVGIRIARTAAETLKHVALELGGKGANIIFADADLDKAVADALFGFTVNQGQECCAGGRILVEDSIADAFAEKLKQAVEAMQVGLVHDDPQIGPLIHEAHLDRVVGYIEAGKADGAKVLTGGRRLTDGALAKGWFVTPTVFTEVTPDMRIFREEIFGPVACMTRFSGVEEAVRLANDTSYGLANGVWSSNIDKAMAVARRLRSGVVYVNSYLASSVQLPFGGVKQSGKGKENGLAGLLEFMNQKSIAVRLATEFG